MCISVCLNRFHPLLWCVLCCMQQRQQWWGVLLCLWSNASARAQYIWVLKMKTCKLSVRRGWSGAKEVKTRAHIHINTHLQVYTHTHIFSNRALWSDWVWSIRIFEIKDHIGGQLLCSTSLHRWHHSVWDGASIFSLRQRSVAAASPASIQGLAQTVSLGVW